MGKEIIFLVKILEKRHGSSRGHNPFVDSFFKIVHDNVNSNICSCPAKSMTKICWHSNMRFAALQSVSDYIDLIQKYRASPGVVKSIHCQLLFNSFIIPLIGLRTHYYYKSRPMNVVLHIEIQWCNSQQYIHVSKVGSVR